MNFKEVSLSRRKPPPTINLTPLIDVVFILLIFFLLTTTFRSTTGLDIELPNASTAKTPAENAQVILNLNQAGELFIGEKQLTQEEVLQALKNNPKPSQKLFIILQADERVAHGEVVSLLDLLRSSGLKNVAIGTQPSSP